MATYAIGDVQGCFDELQRLLKKICFSPTRDRLWFVGDLVNRGPRSLEVLRFVRGLGDRAITVLGNHDLHLVAARLGGRVRPKDTFTDVLEAEDCDELLAWLRGRPLLHVQDDWTMVHAGLPPQWSIAQAQEICADAARSIASARSDGFFEKGMYGDQPDLWNPRLSGWERLRFVINCCTRMRLCAHDGRVDVTFNGVPKKAPAGLVPWFQAPGRRSAQATILCGHWSALGRVHWKKANVYGLDTGCVWGRKLTALRLEDRKIFAVKSEFKGSD